MPALNRKKRKEDTVRGEKLAQTKLYYNSKPQWTRVWAWHNFQKCCIRFSEHLNFLRPWPCRGRRYYTHTRTRMHARTHARRQATKEYSMMKHIAAQCSVTPINIRGVLLILTIPTTVKLVGLHKWQKFT